MFYDKKVNERKPVSSGLFVKLSVIPSMNDVAVNALMDRSRRNSENGTPTWWKSECSSDTLWETSTYMTTHIFHVGNTWRWEVSERRYITLFGTTGRINGSSKIGLLDGSFHVTGQMAINSRDGCSKSRRSVRVPACVRASRDFSAGKKSLARNIGKTDGKESFAKNVTFRFPQLDNLNDR